MKLGLDGFTKIAKEDNITTLRHPAGHEIKINHSVLSPKMRGEIEALPSEKKLADGGSVDSDSYNVGENKIKQPPHLQVPTMRPEEGNPNAETDRQLTLEQPTDTNRSPASEPEKLADGGEVNTKQAAPESLPEPEIKEPSKEEKVEETRKESEGNAPKDVSPVPQPETKPDTASTPAPAQNYDHAAANSEILKNLSAAAAAHFNMTAGATPGADQNAASAVPTTTSAVTSPVASTTPNAATPSTPATPAINTAGTIPSPNIPQQTQTNLNNAQTAQNNFQSYIQDSEAKNKQLFDSAMAQKVDTNRLYNNSSTGAKILSAIGMMFGGIGATAATGGKNLGAEALNNLVQKDVDNQKFDISNKMNLYKMNLEATHNEEEARNMTVNQLLTLAQADIAKQAAGTQNQQAQQNLIMGGLNIDAKKRENDQAAFMAKMRMEALKGNPPGTTSGQLSDQDPAQLIQYLVPEPQVKEVAKEIKDTQDIVALKPKIDAAFEKGSSRNPNTAAQGQREFEGLMNTTVKEQEGTARQAAFDSIKRTMSPSGPTAFPGENDAKRRTFNEYLNSKASMPLSTTYGIHPEKFKSTNFSQTATFTPQQQNNLTQYMKNNPGVTQQDAIAKLKSKGFL